MAKLMIQLSIKQKRGQPTRRTKKQRTKWGDKEKAIRKNPSQCDSKIRSRQIVGNLSPWHRERQGDRPLFD